MNARVVALDALREWRSGRRFADAILQQQLATSDLRPSDRSFATELFYGVLRNLYLLDFWIGEVRSGSLDHASRDLLRLGLYQLSILRTPAHAAIFETVELASRRNRALINAVLRSALGKISELEAAAAAAPLTIRFSHAGFLIERWIAQYGTEAAEALCAWNNQPAPIYARINRLRISVADFLLRNPTAGALTDKSNFVRLDGVPLEALARGECYIQDPSTSLACQLLDPQPGERILDACAAPGGKSALVGELMQNRGEVFACDRDPERIDVLSKNLQTLGVSCARPIRQDWAAKLSPEIGANLFDRILVDAPCSNTGVMRRRVDVRARLAPLDFPRMQKVQLSILRAVLPLLKPRGALVYSTCSLEREENEDVVARILGEFPSLRLETQAAVLPFRHRFDGAFAAKMTAAV